MEHIQSRMIERVSSDLEVLVTSAVNILYRRAKEKQLPSTTWYEAVFQNGKIVAYICGKGTSVKTVLKATMVPHGVQI